MHRIGTSDYRSLFENAVFGIFRSDPTGRITDANRAFCSIVGFDSVKDVIDKVSMFDLFQDISRRQLLLRQSGDQINSFDTTSHRRDGEGIAVRLCGRIVRNAHGGISAFEMFVENVTSRVAREEQLRHSQKMEAVGRLAESIVHDFNNLIAVILTQSELVMELTEIESVRRETDIILNAADRAAGLTRQLLAFSRKPALEPKVFNLNDLIKNLDQMLVRLLTEDVEFTAALSSDLGNILADPSQIEQVVMNLVVNARDAMPEGGRLTIETSNAEVGSFCARKQLSVSPGEYVVLTVSDTGVGMSADVRSRIFEPFFTTKPSGRGTGLGLSTAYAIVKRARGHISLDSEISRGTTFKVYFPRVRCAVEAPRHEKRTDKIVNPAAVILLVEDEERLRRSIGQLLEKAGYSVLSASHAFEALRIAEEHQDLIDLVLTDVGLPHVRGPELVQRLKSLQPQMKALYMSGFGTDSLRPEETACLSGSFIQKPFRKDFLIAQLEHALNEGR
jgi:two-component system, cell cycle sensor histidine kinase and response regulator CckA